MTFSSLLRALAAAAAMLAVAPAQAQSPTRTRLITASPSPAGQPTTLTAEVDALGGGAPRGDVSFADGATSLGSAPLNPLGAGNATIAVGGEHTCAISSAGALHCWGRNNFGQLGDGTQLNRYTPTPVVGLASGVVAVTAGAKHSCALTEAGAVKCWGEGALGDGGDFRRLTPGPVSGLTSGVVAIAAGDTQTCAVTASGVVKCWGSTAAVVADLETTYTTVAAGWRHYCGLTREGGVKCWGSNGDGRLGIGYLPVISANPAQTHGLTRDVVAVVANFGHTCAVTVAGRLLCWGLNGQGQLGDGFTDSSYFPRPVSGLTSGVVAVAAGNRHSCALLNSGGVHCWGDNVAGQLGDGSVTSRRTPAPVASLGGFAVSLSSNGQHSCALLSPTRVVRCWGSNRYGQLGDGASSSGRLPVSVTGFAGMLRSRAQLPAALVEGWHLLRASYDSSSGHATSADSIGHQAQ